MFVLRQVGYRLQDIQWRWKVAQIIAILVATLRHKLESFVERCLFVGPVDCQLLSDTQIASTSCVLVFRGLLLHFPLDLQVGVFLFQGPDVLRQSRAALVLLVPKKLLVGMDRIHLRGKNGGRVPPVV